MPDRRSRLGDRRPMWFQLSVLHRYRGFMKARSGAGQGRWREDTGVCRPTCPRRGSRYRDGAFRHERPVLSPCAAIVPGGPGIRAGLDVGLHGRRTIWAISPLTGKPTALADYIGLAGRQTSIPPIPGRTAVDWDSGGPDDHQGDLLRRRAPAEDIVSISLSVRMAPVVWAQDQESMWCAKARWRRRVSTRACRPFADAVKGRSKILVDSASAPALGHRPHEWPVRADFHPAPPNPSSTPWPPPRKRRSANLLDVTRKGK